MKKRILIVEDEAIAGMYIKMYLADLGYEVMDIATTGEEAISSASQMLPDLILMDIKLGGRMDGIEAAGRISDKHKVPIVFMTAHGDAGTRARAEKARPAGFLEKPIEEKRWGEIIDAVLRRK